MEKVFEALTGALDAFSAAEKARADYYRRAALMADDAQKAVHPWASVAEDVAARALIGMAAPDEKKDTPAADPAPAEKTAEKTAAPEGGLADGVRDNPNERIALEDCPDVGAEDSAPAEKAAPEGQRTDEPRVNPNNSATAAVPSAPEKEKPAEPSANPSPSGGLAEQAAAALKGSYALPDGVSEADARRRMRCGIVTALKSSTAKLDEIERLKDYCVLAGCRNPDAVPAGQLGNVWEGLRILGVAL